jgi:hypothetical protein
MRLATYRACTSNDNIRRGANGTLETAVGLVPPKSAGSTDKAYNIIDDFLTYISDLGIFIHLVRPVLKERADAIREGALPKSRRYVFPSGISRLTVTRRTNEEIARILSAYWRGGIFETHIVSMVSRFEAALQESISVRVKENLEKLEIIADAKTGVPLDIIISSANRDVMIEKIVALRCEELMFKRPSFYIEKAKQILEIRIRKDLEMAYLEIKASRDVVIHNRGRISGLYLEKAGSAARGKLGDEILIDQDYFLAAVNAFSDLAIEIMKGIEQRIAATK